MISLSIEETRYMRELLEFEYEQLEEDLKGAMFVKHATDIEEEMTLNKQIRNSLRMSRVRARQARKGESIEKRG